MIVNREAAICSPVEYFTVGDRERRQENEVLAAQMLQYLYLIREFECRVLNEYYDRGKVHGPLHSSIGQEAVAVGVSAALAPEDTITSTHRGHHHFLAKSFFFHCGIETFDPRGDQTPEKLAEICSRTMSEILGLEAGYSRGRGGSMHLAAREAGILGTNGIVGGGIAIACGAALREKLRKGGSVSLSYFGEGASNQGILAECLNMAGLWKLPVIFLLENNGYSVATPVERSVNVRPVSLKACGAGVPVFVVDGMDPTAVRLCVGTARERARAGMGPVMVECTTYRYKHQGGSDDGTSFGYRSKEEVAEWLLRDPLTGYSRGLLSRGVLSEEQLQRLRARAVDIVDEACNFVNRQTPPETAAIDAQLHGSDAGLRSLRYREIEDYEKTSLLRYVDCISDTLRRRMRDDPRIFVMGEEVGSLGGAFGATRGLREEFPGRVIDTPISEAGFSGMGLGASITGARAVIEIMYPDFAMVAADPLLNQIPKYRYMFGGQFDVPLVVRTRCAIGSGYGAQHSLDPAALFALFPGWRIVAPSTPFDLIGLLNTALRCEDPVLFIEHALLYNSRGPVPVDDRDFAVPFGKARVEEKGNELVIVSYSYMAGECRAALRRIAERGIGATLIDLRTLDFQNIDWECLEKHLRLSGRMLICEQAPLHASIGSVIADRLGRDCFDYLDAPVHRLGGADIPLPASKNMEYAATLHAERIAIEAEKICRCR